MLRFSIITVTYNAAPLLKKTIESVACQDNDEFEYIVIDGNSTDDTKNILNEYGDCLSKVVSEPDKGIYDAMNKGILLAEGEYCMFLNAGDILYSNDTLKNAADLIALEDADVYYADAFYVKTGRPDVYFTPQIEKLPFRFCHQAMFFKTSIIKQNMYDQKYHLSGDSELVYRLYEQNFKFKHLPVPIVRELSGEGATERNLMTSTRELYSIPYLRTHMPFYKILYNKNKIVLYCILRKLHLI